MKKVIYSVMAIAVISFSSCGASYSEEAGKAAESFCSCAKDLDIAKMKEDPSSAMQLLGCMEEPMKYMGDDKEKTKEVEAAIKDKCPDVYEAMESLK